MFHSVLVYDCTWFKGQTPSLTLLWILELSFSNQHKEVNWNYQQIKANRNSFPLQKHISYVFSKILSNCIHSTEAPAFFRYSFWLSIPNTEQELIPKAKNFKAKKDSNSGEIKAIQRQCDVLQPGTDPTPVWCAVCDNLGNQSIACVSHLIVPNPYRIIEAQSTTRDRFIISEEI